MFLIGCLLIFSFCFTEPSSSQSLPVRLIPEHTEPANNLELPVTTHPPELFQIHVFSAKRTSELVKLVQIIPLQETSKSILGSVRSLAVLSDRYLLIDIHRDAVYQFGKDGRFLGFFAGKGEGPGEFSIAESLQKDHLGRIWLQDGGAARFNVYDQHGKPLFSTPVIPRALNIGTHFILGEALWYQTWPDQEGSGTWVKVDFRESENRFEPLALTKFSQYWGPLDKPIAGYLPGAKVGRTIWLGSPYASQIRIYNLDGVLMGVLDAPVPRRLTVDMLREGDFKTERDFELFRQTHTRTLSIFSDSGVVWINQLPYTCQIYDESGALLSEKPLINDLTKVIHFEDSYLYLVTDQKNRLYGEQIRQALGERAEDFENPVLLRLKLKGFRH